MAEEKRDFKGVWIPKKIWVADYLTVMEKLMLVEIDSLDNEEDCYASNKHFAEFFKLSNNRVSEIITSLKNKGLISVQYEKEGKRIVKRIIKVFGKSKGAIRKVDEGYSEKGEENNTLSNNTKEYIVEIIDYLNSKANTKYKSTSTKTQTLIKTRLAEGFTLEDFKQAITNKVAEWKGTEWEKFLRPDTLFSNKFEGYVNQKINKSTTGKVDKFNSYPQREYDFKNLENNLLGYVEEGKE